MSTIMTTQQREFFLPMAVNAAVRAGAAILEVYPDKSNYQVDYKADQSPITLADRRAHDVIKQHLSQTRMPILSEEGREMQYFERKGWDLFWMVDPLDGTREFIKGNNEFTVNIALIADNRPVMGIIYVPYFHKLYFTEKGFGSYVREVAPDAECMLEYDEIYEGAHELPLHKEPNSPLRVAISRSHNNEATFERIKLFRGLYPDAELVEQGSSYKFCLLAEGTIDYYPRTSNTYEWDTAAGEVILSEAGGVIKALPDMAKFAYNKESLLNPHFVCRSHAIKDVVI
ncbi:MAG: 3'(2'),5'-bisphosphate nucleotidase CysQ [Rikenellaceae bacterium]|nr:3'(2'),5'-bisphosphate nucleotidase CysQ [Rikenellaceae bacterium]